MSSSCRMLDSSDWLKAMLVFELGRGLARDKQIWGEMKNWKVGLKEEVRSKIIKCEKKKMKEG